MGLQHAGKLGPRFCGETLQQGAASVIVQNNTPFHILIVIFWVSQSLSGSAFIILRIKIHKKKRYL